VAALTPVQAKGLEFAAVVVLAPAGIAAAAPQGGRDLYVAITRAASRPAVETVHLDLDDLAGLAASSAEAAREGFSARLCVHPSQVGPVREAFAPDDAEVEWARAVLEAAEHAPSGVFRFRGRMVDEPLLRQARAVLRRSGG